ncbi:hypothetical protein [Nostoc sp.]|uniref:hypothetical protein n=1 Tax=Nostoc sp. TaxID=1180 RepID=UPI002FFB10D7
MSFILVNESLNSVNESLIFVNESLNSVSESLNSVSESLILVNESLNSVNESLVSSRTKIFTVIASGAKQSQGLGLLRSARNDIFTGHHSNKPAANQLHLEAIAVVNFLN